MPSIRFPPSPVRFFTDITDKFSICNLYPEVNFTSAQLSSKVTVRMVNYKPNVQMVRFPFKRQAHYFENIHKHKKSVNRPALFLSLPFGGIDSRHTASSTRCQQPPPVPSGTHRPVPGDRGHRRQLNISLPKIFHWFKSHLPPVLDDLAACKSPFYLSYGHSSFHRRHRSPVLQGNHLLLAGCCSHPADFGCKVSRVANWAGFM